MSKESTYLILILRVDWAVYKHLNYKIKSKHEPNFIIVKERP